MFPPIFAPLKRVRKCGPVVQLVRTLACHARGQGFESPSGRQPKGYASVAQLVEQGIENPRVVGSIPTGGTIRGFSSFGRARPCQGRGGGFEPRNPLQKRAASKQCGSNNLRRHSQVVRPRSAKPLFPGSNPGDASRNKQVERLAFFE